MKTYYSTALFLAALLPAIALASVSSERIQQANSEPLSPKTSTVQATPVSVENDQGQSEALTKAQAAVKQSTNRPTAHRAADDAPKASLGNAPDW